MVRSSRPHSKRQDRGDLRIASTRMHPYLTITIRLHADALVVRGEINLSV